MYSTMSIVMGEPYTLITTISLPLFFSHSLPLSFSHYPGGGITVSAYSGNQAPLPQSPPPNWSPPPPSDPPKSLPQSVCDHDGKSLAPTIIVYGDYIEGDKIIDSNKIDRRQVNK